MDRRAFARALATLAAVGALPALAADPVLPKGPIRVVVGFPPGGGTDVIARIITSKLGALWGVPVVVDNKAGAAGLIAASDVAKAAPDGNTLMLGHINALGIAPGLHARLNYSAERDFTAIALVGKTPQVLVASRTQPVKTVQALIDLARKTPSQVTFGSAGSGSAQHLALALFEQRAGISVLHVPYKGSAPLATDLLGGHVQFAFEGMTTATPFIKEEKMIAIAQTGNKRVKSFPNVPTVAESGFPGFDASIWFGLVGPAGLPPPMVARINADVNKVLAMPEVAARLEEFGAEDGGGTPERFAEFMRIERAKWAKLIKDKKITAEG